MSAATEPAGADTRALVAQILAVAGAYERARGLRRSYVSSLAFGDGKVLDRLADGGDLYTGRYKAAMQWFSDNWPANAAWPDSVDRPQPGARP